MLHLHRKVASRRETCTTYSLDSKHPTPVHEDHVLRSQVKCSSVFHTSYSASQKESSASLQVRNPQFWRPYSWWAGGYRAIDRGEGCHVSEGTVILQGFETEVCTLQSKTKVWLKLQVKPLVSISWSLSKTFALDLTKRHNQPLTIKAFTGPSIFSVPQLFLWK